MSKLPTEEGKKAIEANRSILSPDEQRTVDLLLANDQSHLFAHWPPAGQQDDDKHRFLKQCALIESAYLGGIKTYVSRAKELLAFAQQGGNPYEGYKVQEPTDSARIDSYDAFKHYESLGLSAVPTAAFVIVAGGLGERLGYKGIKLALPSEIVTDTPYIQLYIQFILALQSRARKATSNPSLLLPLAIMTSDDTDTLTQKLLKDNHNFGMTAEQLIIFKQGKVPSLLDNDAHFTLDDSDKYALDTKPHGHGDVHMLLYQNHIIQRWVQEQGRKHVVFFQDTNGLVFRAIPAALGVSVEKGLEVNSLTVPRVQGDAVGAICKLVREPGTGNKTGEQLPDTLTINVEYNQLEGLMGKGAKEPLVSGTKNSVYPGNINVLIFDAVAYLRVLEDKKGAISEFVNPKYNPDKKSFKKPTRLECFGTDTRVLTDRGFMTIEQLEAAATLPRFACYDKRTEQIVYRTGKLADPDPAVELINFTEKEETIRWAPGSGDDGMGLMAGLKMGEDFWRSGHLSLRVTPDHYMFAQQGTNKVHKGVITGGRRRLTNNKIKDYRRVKAQALLDDTGAPWIRFLAHADKGIRVEGGRSVMDEFADALDIANYSQMCAFLELYGFWLGDGTLSYKYYARQSSWRCYGVVFNQKKGTDIKWLFDMIAEAGLVKQVDWVAGKGNSNGTRTIAIIKPEWIAFFNSEYHRKYKRGPASVAASAPMTEVDINMAVSSPTSRSSASPSAAGPRLSSLLSPPTSTATAPSSTHASKKVNVEVIDLTDVVDSVDEDDEPVTVEIVIERAKSVKWFMEWVFIVLTKDELRLVLEGLRRADGSWAGDKLVIYTASVHFRDQIVRLLLHAGYSAFFYAQCKTLDINGYNSLDASDRRVYRPSEVVGREQLFRPIRATVNGYTVNYAEPDSNSGKQACWPTITHGEITRETYTGRLWCVSVDHPDHLIFVQRFHANADGVVTKAGKVIIAGQCMMQDWPKLLSADAKVGFSEFQRWTSFSAVKNAVADAAQKQKDGNAPESGASGEADLYAWTARVLNEAGANVEDPDTKTYKGVQVKEGAKVVLTPAFGVTQEEIHGRVRGGDKVRIHKDATVVLDGAITLSALDVHGAVVIRAVDGAEVDVNGLVVNNGGWSFEEIGDEKSVDQKYAVRGYTLKKAGAEEYVFDKAGKYTLSEQTKEQYKKA